MTTKFEIRPLSEMPPRTNETRSAFLAAVRDLGPDEALFLPCPEGRNLASFSGRISVSLSKNFKGQVGRRTDPKQNGIWIFRKVTS